MVNARSSALPPVRSISLPSRLHPISLRVESQLNKLRTWELTSEEYPTAKTVQSGLVALAELYNRVDELIHSSFFTQQQSLLEEAVDESVKLLDTCGTAKDMLSKIKEHVQSLQSSLRIRANGSFECEISGYISFRKNVKRESGQCIKALKLGKRRLRFLPNVVDVLREVNAITSVVFRYVFLFLSTSASGLKSNKLGGCSLLSKFRPEKIMKKKIMNEVGSVDEALCKYFLHNGAVKDEMQMVHTKLETLAIRIDGLGAGLDLVFRRLIRYRVSSLNVLAQ